MAAIPTQTARPDGAVPEEGTLLDAAAAEHAAYAAVTVQHRVAESAAEMAADMPSVATALSTGVDCADAAAAAAAAVRVPPHTAALGLDIPYAGTAPRAGDTPSAAADSDRSMAGPLNRAAAHVGARPDTDCCLAVKLPPHRRDSAA